MRSYWKTLDFIMRGYMILAVFVVALNVFSANGFLFGTSAPKDGCNPNPCKNKADCIKDPRDPMKPGTCKCQTGFYGAKCENKDGCYSKPCKSGACIVDFKDKSKFKCQCAAGKVGEKCDKNDECLKSPCKNGGTCALDAKFKAVCTCPNGWTSKSCDKRNCTIVEFKGKHFAKLPKIYIDKSVEPIFKEFDNIAKKCKVSVVQTKSYIVQPNKVVIPQEAPFYAGRGLEFTLNDENGKILCNGLCLSKKPIPQPAAKCFIDGVISKGWKWTPDQPTIIHDGLFLNNNILYNKLRETAQVGCKDKTF